MQPEPLLRINGISKTYSGEVKALNNVSLTIPAGMYGLLGPNGAGKSTLMRILATLQQPDSGSINFSGIDTLINPYELRKTLGYLPQDFGVYKNVSAEKLLRHFAILKGVSVKVEVEKTVETLLKRTNLWEVRKRKLGGYSGGMKQRFGVAVALIGNPKLMIVDEPTAGLDPAERVRFLNLLSELGENSAVILSTHIVEDVSELCTNMAIINKGEILMEAVPLEAMRNLKGKIWRRVIEKNELSQFEETYDVISTKLLAGQTFIHIYSKTNPENGFKAINPDLEDVYFSTMSGFIAKYSIQNQKVQL